MNETIDAPETRKARSRDIRTSSAKGLALMALGLTSSLLANPAQAQVQGIVASSPSAIAPGNNAGIAVVDACGDVYINPYGGLIEIQAGTGVVKVLYPNTNGYGGGPGLAIDQKKANLYFPESGDWYSSRFAQVPITNCVPGTPNDTFGNNNANSSDGYYFGTGGLITTDLAGDVFFASTNSGQKQILEETAAGTAANVLTSNWPNGLTALASDAAGNIYFADSTPVGSASTSNIYVAKPSAGAYGTPTVFATGFSKNVVGLTFDPAGNLFVADNGNTAVYEIPNEISGGTSALNPADRYQVLSVATVGAVAVDASENIYVSNYNGYFEYRLGSAAAPQVAAGSHVTFPVNFVFNTAQTISSFTTYSGMAPSTEFSVAAGGCSTGAVAAGTNCSVNVTFAPAAVGSRTGALVVAGSSGQLLSTEIAGIGTGAAITVDPGTVTKLSGSPTSPAGVAIDSNGDVFVTDSSANTITKYPAGGGAATPIATGSLTLSAPNGIAVDGAGDLFIADAGNNRVVEIPALGGTLATSSASALNVTLKSPQGVAVDRAGDLFIANTGGNSLVYVPQVNGTLQVALAQNFGTSLNAPSAVTVDPNGSVYIAETGNTDVLSFAAPFGSAGQVMVESGFGNPTGLATDASGSLFVADTKNGTITRFANVGGNLSTSLFAGSSVVAPFGVAVDPTGNLYVTDTQHSQVAEIARVQASLLFGTWNVGTTSVPVSGNVESAGNTSLVFQSPSYTAGGNTTAGFTVTNDGCAGQTIVAGGTCSITATFTPPIREMNATEKLTFASNAAGTPSLALVGSGAQLTPTTLTVAITNPPAGTTLNSGTPVTLTATIGVGAGTVAAGGTMQFFVNGSLAGTSPVAANTASITLPIGLPGGLDSITAQYSGDNFYYSGSQATITTTVIAQADTLTLAVATPYNNPQSVNDNPANATGPSITLTATLVPSQTIAPGGNVTFLAGSTVIGTALVLPKPGGIYQAILITTALRSGSSTVVEDDSFLSNYNITAKYNGDRTYGPSVSNAVAIAVVGPPTTQPACVSAGTCNANTTGAFFTLTPAVPTIVANTTTTPGQAMGSTTIAINSYGGWNGILNFTCTNLPKYAMCAPYPGYPNGVPSTPGATIPAATVNFIIDTNVAPIVPTGSSVYWIAGGAAGLMLLWARRRSSLLATGAPRLLSAVLMVMLVGAAGISLNGCGSSTSYPYITPAGTYMVNVQVSAAQLVPNRTDGKTFSPDPNPPSFTIALTVK
jgi:sugar lactone lactonase YvrE